MDIEKKMDLHRFLGLPPDASPAEMERRCEDLLDWLESDSIPEGLRTWASGQHALVQDIYDDLEVPDGEDVVGERAGVQAPSASVSIRVGRRRGSFLSGLAGKPLALATIGVVLGLVVVGALWWRGVIFSGGEEAQTPAAEETFDPAQYLNSQQGRIEELKRVVAANPKDVDALFELGETHIVGEDWEGTIYWFTKLLEVDPTNVHARMDIGTATMSLGRYSEAEAAFKKVLEMEPENAQAHYNTGFLFAFRADAPDMEEAVNHWREVIRLAPGSDLAAVAQVHIDQFQSSGPAR